MSNAIIPTDFIMQHQKLLDIKKDQTTYKIKYVSQYVQKWLYVVTNIPEVQNINFVDCMCNAGIYSDGELGTAIKVLECFNDIAPNHSDKTFNLILNDINTERLEIIETIISDFIKVKSDNIHIVINNSDVNDFLLNDQFFEKYFNCYPSRSSNVVFVDPYNFCTVKISVLEHFLSKKYCELIFNIFTSDYVRNQDKKKMREFCKSESIATNLSKKEMIDLITSRLKIGNIKFSFSYEFKSIKNAEIYQIMFFTPNLRGLEKLKESLWDTFNGKEFHRNSDATEGIQTSLFSLEDERDWRLESHSASAKDLLIQSFQGQVLDYISIESYIIENTMLDGDHLIKQVLKPLMSEGKIFKLGQVNRANNFKSDKYQIGEKYGND